MGDKYSCIIFTSFALKLDSESSFRSEFLDSFGKSVKKIDFSFMLRPHPLIMMQ